MPTASRFGPKSGLDSKDYAFKMSPLTGEITASLVDLLGHSLTAPNQNLTDAVTFTDVELRGGRIVTVSRVKRAAQETSRTYTIGLPSAIWTPVQEQALANGCESTFFMIYLCPPDDIYAHWDILPESILNPPIEAEDVITNGEDTNIITQTAELQTPGKLRGFGLSFRPIYDTAAATDSLNDIVFKTQTCATCGGGYAQGMIAAGGDGTAVGIVVSTDDRFSNVSSIPSGGAATHVGSALYTDGDLILLCEVLAGAPDTGILYRSLDGGATWVVVAGIGEPILDIIDAEGTIVLVGGEATNGGVVYISDDNGSTFTQVTSSVIPATESLNGVAFDKDTGKLFIGGGGATLLSGRFSGSTVNLVDISANLNGAPNDLFDVCVRGNNEIVVCGDAGYLSQSRDGGTTFSSIGIGTSSDIVSVDGNRWRLMCVAGTTLFEQTALTNYQMTAKPLADGLSVVGNYTRIRMNIEDDFNRFVAITDDGEVVLGVPNYPNA